MNTIPLRFIGEPISVIYDIPQVYEKSPKCPSGFIWNQQTYQVSELLEEWADFSRKGRAARNMQPQHASRASARGSWGVGKFFFRVKTDNGQIFEIYYDRAPKDVNDRKGAWFLLGERKSNAE